MPGSTIAGFARRSVQIAMAGVYDLRIHRDEVLAPVLRAWKVWDIEGLGGEGEKAREQLATFLDELDVAASRFEDRRDQHRERVLARTAQS
jgi:acyl-[acyl-carrier-protein] desaturase